jgi:hypothetical protein
MSHDTTILPPPPASAAANTPASAGPTERREPRNLLVFVCYEIVFRVAWIFKTESVIVPAFVDALTGGTGFIRGWLPVLARVGQSIPPLLYAERLRRTPLKSRVLRWTCGSMMIPTAGIAGIAYMTSAPVAGWVPILFLALYVVFFCVTGINQLVLGTLHGKLLRADRRGRLMWISGVIGPVLAIAAAWWLLDAWLVGDPIRRFGPIFTLTAAGFLTCALITLGLNEQPDAVGAKTATTIASQFRAAWWVYRTDAAFRRAANVVMLVTSIVIIFPHFQWLAQQELQPDSRELMVWVIAQNVGVALFSPFCGLLADRAGNRIVLRAQCAVLMTAPLFALWFTAPEFQGRPEMSSYWVVFVVLGMSPVSMRTINNYTLELVPTEMHPLYLSTMRVCFLVPFVFAPAAGWLLDMFPSDPHLGARWLFCAVSVLIGMAGLLTFRMVEPRHQKPTLPAIVTQVPAPADDLSTLPLVDDTDPPRGAAP